MMLKDRSCTTCNLFMDVKQFIAFALLQTAIWHPTAEMGSWSRLRLHYICAAFQMFMDVTQFPAFAFLEMVALRLGAKTGALSGSMWLLGSSCTAGKRSIKTFCVFALQETVVLRLGAQTGPLSCSMLTGVLPLCQYSAGSSSLQHVLCWRRPPCNRGHSRQHSFARCRRTGDVCPGKARRID